MKLHLGLSAKAKEAIKVALAMVVVYAIAMQMGWDKPHWAAFTGLIIIGVSSPPESQSAFQVAVDTRPLRLQQIQQLGQVGGLLNAAESDSYAVWDAEPAPRRRLAINSTFEWIRLVHRTLCTIG